MDLANLYRHFVAKGVSLRTDRDGETRYYNLQVVPVIQSRSQAYQGWKVQAQYGADMNEMSFVNKCGTTTFAEALDVYEEVLAEKKGVEKKYFEIPPFGYSKLADYFKTKFNAEFAGFPAWKNFERYFGRVLTKMYGGQSMDKLGSAPEHRKHTALLVADLAFCLPEGVKELSGTFKDASPQSLSPYLSEELIGYLLQKRTTLQEPLDDACALLRQGTFD